MRIAKTLSITLPPELLTKAQEFASREHRTMSELVRDALRRYMTSANGADREGWTALLEKGQTHGRSLGIKSEDDINRMLGEFRTRDRA